MVSTIPHPSTLNTVIHYIYPLSEKLNLKVHFQLHILVFKLSNKLYQYFLLRNNKI